jgi:hypothetical protein
LKASTKELRRNNAHKIGSSSNAPGRRIILLLLSNINKLTRNRGEGRRSVLAFPRCTVCIAVDYYYLYYLTTSVLEPALYVTGPCHIITTFLSIVGRRFHYNIIIIYYYYTKVKFLREQTNKTLNLFEVDGYRHK